MVKNKKTVNQHGKPTKRLTALAAHGSGYQDDVMRERENVYTNIKLLDKVGALPAGIKKKYTT